jgi:predicted alpha/beta hydrolase family esterase
MSRQVLFIQGGGNGGYEADAALASSLQEALGVGYDVKYPLINANENAPDFGWTKQLAEKIAASGDNLFIVAHSFGASLLLKYLSENSPENKIAGIFLIATPFCHGDEAWKAGFKLQEDFAEKLPKGIPVFFYHCRDDEEVPFSHLSVYKQKLPRANFREIPRGGHQMNNDLSLVAEDIKSL